MDVKSAADTLLLFNDKTDKLENLSFTKELGNSGVTISGKLGQSVQAQRHGPDDESIDAFVLTMRFFVQDNEITVVALKETIWLMAEIDKLITGWPAE